MGFVTAVKRGFSQYFRFSGRASRSEYWWFVLFCVICSFVLSLVDAAVFPRDPETLEPVGILSGLFGLLVTIPLLSAGWRRLQDSNRRGIWIFVPTFLVIAFLVFVFGGILGASIAQNLGVSQDALLRPAQITASLGVIAYLACHAILALVILWWLIRPGTRGSNRFGHQVD